MGWRQLPRVGGPSLIVALGITQVVGYGTLYYAFTVLAPRMTASFGWAPEWTYGGFALGLLVGGAVAPFTGRLIDRWGTRMVMTIGSLLAGLSLLALAEARGLASYCAAMIAIQAVSTMVFYDAAFAALTQARGKSARRAISQLTLIGGFASTLYWPLTTTLLGSLDWRDVYRIYALSQS
jgi:MFS family permease